jgi:hypothetical protein
MDGGGEMKRPSNVAMFCGKCMKVRPFFLRGRFYICENCGIKIRTALIFPMRPKISDLPKAA